MGIGFAHVSRRAGGLDSDTLACAAIFNPARTRESFIKATYQYQVDPWLTPQPDIQYVFNPGGGIANASGPATKPRWASAPTS